VLPIFIIHRSLSVVDNAVYIVEQSLFIDLQGRLNWIENVQSGFGLCVFIPDEYICPVCALEACRIAP
jgi:hypothetical protein